VLSFVVPDRDGKGFALTDEHDQLFANHYSLNSDGVPDQADGANLILVALIRG
jgi:hypothetical protein